VTIASASIGVAPPPPPASAHANKTPANRGGDFAEQFSSLKNETDGDGQSTAGSTGRGVSRRAKPRSEDKANNEAAGTAAISTPPPPPPAPAPLLPFQFNGLHLSIGGDRDGQIAETGVAFPAAASAPIYAAPLPVPPISLAPPPAGTAKSDAEAPAPAPAPPPEEGRKAARSDSPDVPRPEPMPKELAFVARVTSTDRPKPPVANPQRHPASDAGRLAAASAKEDELQAQTEPVVSSPSTTPSQAVAAFEQNSRLTAAPEPHMEAPASTQQARVEHSSAEVRPSAAPVMKDISFQVSRSGEDNVQVRLVQQDGELHVVVRTGDSRLATGLQQSLPELVTRLQENGFRTETWRPGGPGIAPLAAAETQNSSADSRNTDSQSQPGWSHDGGQRNPNQQHNERPHWLEELESSLSGSAAITGESHGIAI
jgi:hypothetical protein